jgi:hypothetical protein
MEKKMHRLQVYSVFVVFSLILSCANNKNNPLSYVDSYSPQLLDPKGTVYQGNYFPLTNGLKWKTTGIEEMTTNNHVVIAGPQGSIDTTEVDTTYTSLSCTSMTQGQQSFSIGGKGYSVTPISRRTIVATSDSSDTLASTEYYETADSSVFLRAYVEETAFGFDTIRADSSVFLKLPLAAGDRWETVPVSALSTMGAENSDSLKNLKIQSMTFVIGRDTCSVGSATRQALQLDQVFQVSFTVSDSESITSVSSTGVSHIYLAKDTGVVKVVQNQNITMKMSMMIQEDTARNNTIARATSSEELLGFATGQTPLAKIVNGNPQGLSRSVHPKERPIVRSVAEARRKALLKATLLARALLM